MPFQQITGQVGAGEADGTDWRSVRDIPLHIFVGLSGAGKTTLCNRLLENGSCRLLPDRRSLTDELILPVVQVWDGHQGAITDRAQRFEATRRFRERYPGGMGRLLSELWVRSNTLHLQWIFDGLRGLEEVRYAAEHLPRAVFIVLSASDGVRIQRLLARQDRFDAMNGPPVDWDTELWREAFSLAEQQELLRFLEQHRIGKSDFLAKYRIMAKEREHYDHESTLRYLEQSVPARTVRVDTAGLTEMEVYTNVCRGLAWID